LPSCETFMMIFWLVINANDKNSEPWEKLTNFKVCEFPML